MLNGGIQSLDGGATHRFTPSADEEFSVAAVHYDGTNDNVAITGEPSGMVDGKEITVSVWGKKDVDDKSLFYLRWDGQNYFYIKHDVYGTSDLLRIKLYHSGNIVDFVPTETIHVADGWVNILFSLDAANTTARVYINDVATANTPTVEDRNINFTDTNWSVGTHYSSKWSGDMAEFYCTNEYIDLSVESNRRKFIDGDGKPVDLGSDGSEPTGTAALFYLKADADTPDNWANNHGSSSNFVVAGAFTNASSSPTD